MTPMTPELRQAVRDAGNDPVWLKDMESNADYVLIRAELFRKVQSLVFDADPDEMYPLRANLAPEDWEDGLA
ncbi:MAG TPA: hypothetical protein VMV69_28180 [Pirellulales bacterium]|nr:hypothetical protein [Pirellulales bacterium]